LGQRVAPVSGNFYSLDAFAHSTTDGGMMENWESKATETLKLIDGDNYNILRAADVVISELVDVIKLLNKRIKAIEQPNPPQT
jgi:hypothetical protein